MVRTRHGTDRGVIARMGAARCLLGLVFVAFIAVLIYLLGAFSNISNGSIIVIAVVLGVAVRFGSYFYSDKIAL